jgi:hypothetical protein
MGSVAVAAWIAVGVFPLLLVRGLVTEELSPRAAAVFVALALAAWIGLPRLPGGGYLETPVVAVLDIVLVLMVFKADVRIGP